AREGGSRARESWGATSRLRPSVPGRCLPAPAAPPAAEAPRLGKQKKKGPPQHPPPQPKPTTPLPRPTHRPAGWRPMREGTRRGKSSRSLWCEALTTEFRQLAHLLVQERSDQRYTSAQPRHSSATASLTLTL